MIVLDSIATGSSPQQSVVKDVPFGKLDANGFSDAVKRLIKEAMSKTSLVDGFLSTWHDEGLGERLAEAFKSKYQELRGESLSPGQIFRELQSWAGGNDRGTPEHELAVLTVMAYYFERCDIFEAPRSVTR